MSRSRLLSISLSEDIINVIDREVEAQRRASPGHSSHSISRTVAIRQAILERFSPSILQHLQNSEYSNVRTRGGA